MKFQEFLSRTSRFVLCLTASYALPLYAAPRTDTASVTRAALDPSVRGASRHGSGRQSVRHFRARL